MGLISDLYNFITGFPHSLSENIKKTFYQFCILVFIFVIVLWFSASLYALIYYLYIPAVAHVKPVYLKYDVRCMEKGKCVFPYDNITLVHNNEYELLSRGQIYAIELMLDMPETHRNIDQGMFMVRLDMQSETGVSLKSSHRPAIIRYKSPFLKIINTLFFAPAFLLGSAEEKQSLAIPLFEAYQESYHHPAHYAFVEIQAVFAEIYSCSLRIHAQFTGLRYMMYYWPITSAVAGIAMISSTVTMMFIIIWLQQIMNAENYINLRSIHRNEDSFVREIRQTMQEKAAKESLQKKGIQEPKISKRLKLDAGKEIATFKGITRQKSDKGKGPSSTERIEEVFPPSGIARQAGHSSSTEGMEQVFPPSEIPDTSEKTEVSRESSFDEEMENITFLRDSEDEFSLGEEESQELSSKSGEPSGEIEDILHRSESTIARKRR